RRASSERASPEPGARRQVAAAPRSSLWLEDLMVRCGRAVLCVVLLLAAWPPGALAQKSVAEVLGGPATPEGQPKSYLTHRRPYSYIERDLAQAPPAQEPAAKTFSGSCQATFS